MRSFIQFCVAAVCIGLVGSGLYMSLNRIGEGVVLASPGTPGRLVAETSSATAFFEHAAEQGKKISFLTNGSTPEEMKPSPVILIHASYVRSCVVPKSKSASAGTCTPAEPKS